MAGSRPAGARDGLAARVANGALGAWLVVSVLLWPHDASEGFNTIVTGLLLVTVAPISIWAPRLRFGGAFLGAWLVVTTLLFPHAVRFTLFHDLAAALVMLAVALVPSRPWTYRAGRARA